MFWTCFDTHAMLNLRHGPSVLRHFMLLQSPSHHGFGPPIPLLYSSAVWIFIKYSIALSIAGKLGNSVIQYINSEPGMDANWYAWRSEMRIISTGTYLHGIYTEWGRQGERHMNDSRLGFFKHTVQIIIRHPNARALRFPKSRWNIPNLCPGYSRTRYWRAAVRSNGVTETGGACRSITYWFTVHWHIQKCVDCRTKFKLISKENLYSRSGVLNIFIYNTVPILHHKQEITEALSSSPRFIRRLYKYQCCGAEIINFRLRLQLQLQPYIGT